jgi:segregation and condensation protein B
MMVGVNVSIQLASEPILIDQPPSPGSEPPSPELISPELISSERTTPEPDAPEVGATSLDLAALPGGARGALEAVLMVVDEPVEEMALASALTLPVDHVRALVRALAAEYDAAGRGFELREVAGGWRVFSRPAYAEVVERFIVDGQTARLTQAALETLAIVAYRQPVSRARVSAVRGVNVDGVMRTLATRGLVEESGHDRETGAVLYSTTTSFLHRLGLTSLDELPALAPYLPEMDALDEIEEGLA